MRNISTKGEDINLVLHKCYYVIDALYLNSIKSGIDNLDIHLLDKEIEEKVFPYTNAPFAKITNISSFKIQNINKAKYEEINNKGKKYFSSDTGLIAFIAEEVLVDFLKIYDYNKLVEAMEESVNLDYWDEVTSKFGLNNLGLILAPGIDSGYEFIGSGIYKIQI